MISPSIKNNSKVNSKEVSIIQTVKEKSVLADDEKKKNSPLRPINNVSISREEKNTINNKSKESKKENKNNLSNINSNNKTFHNNLMNKTNSSSFNPVKLSKLESNLLKKPKVFLVLLI